MIRLLKGSIRVQGCVSMVPQQETRHARTLPTASKIRCCGGLILVRKVLAAVRRHFAEEIGFRGAEWS